MSQHTPAVTARQTSARLDVTLAYEVTGAPDRQAPYSRTGIMYRPSRVVLHITPGPDSWDMSVAVTGHRVLKSGETGTGQWTERWYAVEPEALPDWLQDIRDDALSTVATKGWTA